MSLNIDGSVAGTPEGIRVFPIEGEYVVADRGGWIPGTFATVEDAVEFALEMNK